MRNVIFSADLRRVLGFSCAALLLRILWLLLVDVEPVSDGVMYREFAHGIANGLGYAYPSGRLTAFWAVGTAGFYGLVNFLFGLSDWPIVIANLILGMGVVGFTYSIALRYFGASVATVAGWLVALWPVLIQFTTVYASELLFLFFLLGALHVWGGAIKLNTVLKSMLWGTLLCIATYVRPTALPLFIALPIVYWWSSRDLRGALASGVIAVATAAVLFSPWVIRNQQVFGSPVLVSANFGSNLWMGNNPQSSGAYMPLPDIQFTNEVAKDQYFKALAMDFIKAHPAEFARLALRRFVITYDRETIGVVWNEPALIKLAGARALPYLKLLSTVYWWLLAATASLGVGWALWRRKISVFNPLLVVVAFFFIVPVLTVGQDRYHLPLNPLLAIFAAFALQSLWSFLKGNSIPLPPAQQTASK